MGMDIARPDLLARKKKKKLALIGIGVGLLGCLITAAIVLGNAAPSVRKADVLVDTVRKGDFVRGVRGPGKLVPNQTRWAIARTDASVDKILARAGSTVHSNSIILELNNPAVQEQLQTANATFSAAQSDHIALRAKLQSDMFTLQSELAEIRGSFESAKIQEEASRRAAELGVLSDVEYRRMKIAVEQLKARLDLAERRVANFQSNMKAQLGADQARLAQLKNTADLRAAEADSLHVRAGMDGILQRVEVEEGQRVTVGQNLARIAKPEGLIAEIYVPESQAAQLASGLAATIQIAGRKVPGQVLRVDPAIKEGTVRVEVALTSELPEGSRPEQSVEGSIVLGKIQDALFVGRPVNITASTTGNVYRLIDDETAVRTEVRFGAESLTEVQILSGLKEGDRIILSDLGTAQNAKGVSLN
jgi:HlyD family secretion protein